MAELKPNTKAIFFDKDGINTGVIEEIKSNGTIKIADSYSEIKRREESNTMTSAYEVVHGIFIQLADQGLLTVDETLHFNKFLSGYPHKKEPVNEQEQPVNDEELLVEMLLKFLSPENVRPLVSILAPIVLPLIKAQNKAEQKEQPAKELNSLDALRNLAKLIAATIPGCIVIIETPEQ